MIANLFGWTALFREIVGIFQIFSSNGVQSAALFVLHLLLGGNPQDTHMRALVDKCLYQLLPALQSVSAAAPELAAWFRILENLKNTDGQDKMVQYFRERMTSDQVIEHRVIPVLRDLATTSKDSPYFRQLLELAISRLQQMTSTPPTRPKDWKMDGGMLQKICGCSVCMQVVDFMNDPSRQQLRYPLAEVKRKHVHRTIDSSRACLTHITERQGSPFTMVITKTEGEYEQQVRHHNSLLEVYNEFNELMTPHGS
eukprot:TRINITY_DN11251_c0_g1_i1.p1 TRINITY_DN11251_c0_g1~~TRINITY_DN11251_c0_g1_i1.p1  ORF type:complete len:255 (-),score=20.14 TRINITY_DN11251_c0_g1_i1:146-910(-)